MGISENPFAILGAAVSDNRRELAERADEAALLGGTAVDDALTSLMQMNRRIAAELAWFPGSDPGTAETFVSYAKAAAANRQEKLPSLEGIGSPLAQANALAAFFEAWPESRGEYFIGLCRSLDRILSKVTIRETLDLINRDREAGGWEKIPDELTLSGPLEDRLRELCRPVRERAEKVEKDEELCGILDSLSAFSDFDMAGSVGKTLSETYQMRIHDREEALFTSISGRLNSFKDNLSPMISSLNVLKPDMGNWCKMTLPLRKSPGTFFRKATTLSHGMRECLVWYVNHASGKREEVKKTVPTFGGTRVITLTYDSKKDVVRNAREIYEWLMKQFPEQTDQIQLFEQDLRTLTDLIITESHSVEEALKRGR